MASWTVVQGTLSDGLPMRMFLAVRDGKVWAASLRDERHPGSEEEFEFRLGKVDRWQKCEPERAEGVLRDVVEQTAGYFGGTRKTFELPFAWRGTPFQNRVWAELQRIPFGDKKSYGEIAEAIGQEKACRAVGSANGRNHLPLFVPCHRVIASGGKLGGYTGGLGLKTRLLAHEAAVLRG